MDNNFYDETLVSAGIPYDNINWFDIQGQPFGIASQFNAIIFNDANNIIDVKGAMAVGGNFVSPRGLTLGYGNDVKLTGTGYSPDAVRFLVGGSVSMGGPLVVVGHVVAGGNFRAASGSTYLIGKDGLPTQVQELEYLYKANGGSPYWKPSDKGDHYLISSYDVPRYIPAGRIGVNPSDFFEDASESIEDFKGCIEELEVNGTVVDNFHEWVLKGNDREQNVFLIDVRPNGLLNKGIRAEVPDGSLIIVRLRTGRNAHLQYGLLGEERRANHTLYVFEDANEIFMEVPAAIWGSFLAPGAMFHGHSTGGHISGNVAFRSFAVSANSGFEFHLFPFVGGINCGEILPEFPEVPEIMPAPEILPTPEILPAPEIIPSPLVPRVPEVVPMPEIPPAVMPIREVIPPSTRPTPVRPPEVIRPVCPECPVCPEVRPCPIPEPCPMQRPCPECKEPEPCPECPDRVERKLFIKYVPYPVETPCPRQELICPEPIPCPEQLACPECQIKPGIIFGCIWGCCCCKSHDWEVKLFEICNETRMLLFCERVEYCGCFKFEVPYEGHYVLAVCPSRYHKQSGQCKPVLSLKNVGVANFTME
ncbi:MAG: hypothetical protein K0R21_626 [Anaerocolumna sp.]|jgi:choice-of-anchor A domain-containing protein|nr:hypothetical protein [Anaerocolumna sp.]